MDDVGTMFGELSSGGRTGNDFRQIEGFYARQNPIALGKGHGIAFRNFDEFNDWDGRQIAPLFMGCPFRAIPHDRNTGSCVGNFWSSSSAALCFSGLPSNQLPLIGAAKIFPVISLK